MRLQALGWPRSLLDLQRIISWRALQIGSYLNRRRLRRVTFIGITGSAGKTTTKDLSAAVLSKLGSCHSSLRSSNEQAEVFKTVLGTRRRHRFCVVEASAGRPGYLDRSLQAIKPDIAVVTVIAREHYSAFKSLEAIAAEKGKLVAALPSHGIAVLNLDDPLVRAMGDRHAGRIIWVGRSSGATLRLHEARSRWPESLVLQVEYRGERFEGRTQFHGEHLALSILAALGVGLAAGVPLQDAVAALALQEPTDARMQTVTGTDGVVFVRDDWKAPHWSMQAPLDFLRDATAPRKVVVLGTVSDSVKSPSQRYPLLAREALEVADLVVVVGTDGRHALKATPAVEGERLQVFATLEQAARFLRAELRSGDLVLLKGTNRTDHLVRLILDRTRAISCWRSDCGKSKFCSTCPELHRAPAGTSSTQARSGTVVAPQTSDASVPARAGSPLLVIGLGNPGARYLRTAHNLGYRTLDALALGAGAAWQKEAEGHVTSLVLHGEPVRLFKVGVNMNLSGAAVETFLGRTGGEPNRCIVVHDDLDIGLGEAHAKQGGGDGGHKGMRSIISSLQTTEISRVRVGARRNGDKRQTKELVLADFSLAEEEVLTSGLAKAASAVREVVRFKLRQADAGSQAPARV